MSAALSGIGPVSVRYAAQIRELLQSHAIKRMAADEEAARAEAEAQRASRLDAIAKAREAAQPVDAKIDAPDLKDDVKVEQARLANPVRQSTPKPADPAAHREPTAQVIDVTA